MWGKILCVCLLTSQAFTEDSMLAPLYGVRGLNRVMICKAGHEECQGALLNKEWVVTRPSCFRNKPPDELRVLAQWTGERCPDIVSGLEMYMKSMALGVYSNNARRVMNRLVHPSMEFGLIRVDRPYHYVERLANATTVELMFHKNGLWKWMNTIIQERSATRQFYPPPTYSYRYRKNAYPIKVKLNSNPFLLCFVSIILPFALFALLFVYVVFYTGTPDEPQYMNHQYTKDNRED